MKLNGELWAIVDADTGEVLGDGECPSLSTSEPNHREVKWVQQVSPKAKPKVVKCRLVEIE